jgi:hypothetical protein
VHYERKSKGTRAEKYGDPQLIAEIKTVLERKLREILEEEYEQWRDHVKITERGRRLVITSTAPKTHARPQHRQNTQRKNLKTHKNKDTPRGPLYRCSRPVGRGFTAYGPAYKSLRPHHFSSLGA